MPLSDSCSLPQQVLSTLPLLGPTLLVTTNAILAAVDDACFPYLKNSGVSVSVCAVCGNASHTCIGRTAEMQYALLLYNVHLYDVCNRPARTCYTIRACSNGVGFVYARGYLLYSPYGTYTSDC